MKKIFGLGKGLGSLIPTEKQLQPQIQKENVFYVEVAKIEVNPDQPRQDFDEEGIKELAASVRRYGILQPLLVTKVESSTAKGLDVSYQLIAGERRLRAAKMAGLPHVPVVIRDDFGKKNDRLEVSLIENIQRKNLNPIEEAEAYERLTKDFGLGQKEISEKVSKSREAIANTIRLLNLPADIKRAVRAGKVSRSSARGLLAFNDKKQQREMYNRILSGGISTREVENIASRLKPENRRTKRDSKFIELEGNLAKTLNAPVMIQTATKGGRIIIRFVDLEELNKIAKSIID